ncbi:hypothetical protein Tco_0918630 [Tanacetum coccineum]
MTTAKDQRSQSMKEQAYNKDKDQEQRFKNSMSKQSQEIQDHVMIVKMEAQNLSEPRFGGDCHVNFVSRALPNKVGVKVTNLYLVGVIEDEKLFGDLSDEDAVRVCLLLSLKVIFMGRLLVDKIDDSHMRLVENIDEWNVFPWGGVHMEAFV